MLIPVLSLANSEGHTKHLKLGRGHITSMALIELKEQFLNKRGTSLLLQNPVVSMAMLILVAQWWRQGRARGATAPLSEAFNPPSDEILGSLWKKFGKIMHKTKFSVI